MFNSRQEHDRDAFLNGEKLCLISPLFILPFVFWEFSLNLSIPPIWLIIAGNFAEGVFGSVGHSGLTWGLLFLTPEGRKWWGSESSHNLRIKIVFVAIVVFLFSSILFLTASPWCINLFLAIYVCLVLHHAIAQTQGLTFAYSFENRVPQTEMQNIEFVHRIQKYCYKVLTGLVCFYALDGILDFGFLKGFTAKIIYFMVGVIAASIIIASNIWLRGRQTNKIIYLLRNFCIPLGIFSGFAFVGIRVLHSIEYILVYRKMISFSDHSALFTRSQVAILSIALYLLMTFGWFVIFFESGVLRNDYEFATGKPWWFSLLAGQTVTRAMLHFYLDRNIFQMRNPVSRRFWSPLLLGKDFEFGAQCEKKGVS